MNPVCECVSKCKPHDHRWHLGCILPRVPAIIVRAGGYRGAQCDEDGDECALASGDEIAEELSVTPPHAGCGRGDGSTALCANTPGSFSCACRDGYSGIR